MKKHGTSSQIYLKNHIGSVVSSTQHSALIDDDDNRIIIPINCKVSEESGISLEEGIIIEDSNNNQFIWIPIGTVFSKKGYVTDPVIELNRTYQDGNALETNEEFISSNNNIIAKDINQFIESVENYGGFYISRYAASNTMDDIKFSDEYKQINNITQQQASFAAKNYIEDNQYYVSDLVNSYAYNTMATYFTTLSPNIVTFEIWDIIEEWSTATHTDLNNPTVSYSLLNYCYNYTSSYKSEKISFRSIIYLL